MELSWAGGSLFPRSWLFWHSLALADAEGAHSTNGWPLWGQTAPNKEDTCPQGCAPSPWHYLGLFGWPLGIHALISASTSNRSCWQSDARISRHFYSLKPFRWGTAPNSAEEQAEECDRLPLAGYTPRQAYTRYGKALGFSGNPAADSSYVLKQRSQHRDTIATEGPNSTG